VLVVGEAWGREEGGVGGTRGASQEERGSRNGFREDFVVVIAVLLAKACLAGLEVLGQIVLKDDARSG
jgi:hypothetical protein